MRQRTHCDNVIQLQTERTGLLLLISLANTNSKTGNAPQRSIA